MRIAVLANNYPPHTLGGYELLCADHVAWLRGRGHEVVVIASTYGVEGPATERGAAGETVVRTLDFHWRDFQHDRPRGVRLWRGERRQRRELEGLLDTYRIEGVFVWHMAGLSKSLLAVAGRRGLPMVAVVGEPWPAWDIAADAWLRLWRHAALAPLRAAADRAVAPTTLRGGALATLTPAYASEHLRRTVEAGAPAAWPRAGAAVVPNGIALDRFLRPRPPRAADDAALRCLYAGRVERRKGVHVAVEAVRLARARGVPATLTIQGWRDDAYAAELRHQAERAAVPVDWRDAAAREAMPEVYAGHDVLLFPTLWEEPFGLVPLEAMAAGCVVVATGSGGSGEYLEDGVNALLAPKEDAAAMAAHLGTLHSDAALVDRLRQGGVRTAREHSFEDYAARLEALLADRSGRAQ
jgi:glycogen synthase